MDDERVTLVELLIQSVDWKRFELISGPADGFGPRLSDFVRESSRASHHELWQTMENQVFAQDDISTAAEPTIPILIAALLDELPAAVQARILDLLFHLVQGASFRDDELGHRCLARAAEGGWLLVQIARNSGPQIEGACLEVLDICAPDCAQAVRAT